MHRGLALGLMMAGCGLWSTAAAATNADGVVTISSQLAGESAAVAADSTQATTSEASSVNDASSDDWNVSFTPYLWVAGVHGDIGIPKNNNEVEVDKSFVDLLAGLKFGFMGALDVEHKRFVMVSDIMYMNVGVKAEAKNNPGFSAEVGTKMFVGSALFGYRVVDKGPMFVDLFAGGRLTSIDVDLELSGPQGQSIERGVSPSKLSALLGGRIRVPLGRTWGAAVYTDFGGLTESADVRWQLVGTIQHDISSHWRMLAGWRHMQIHHNKNSAEFDMALSGPLIAFSYKF